MQLKGKHTWLFKKKKKKDSKILILDFSKLNGKLIV